MWSLAIANGVLHLVNAERKCTGKSPMFPVFLSKPKIVQINIDGKETAALLLFSSGSTQIP